VIVGSLLLILVAVTLLVLGLATGSTVLLVSSIAASLLAAVALVVGARQATTDRGGVGRIGAEPGRGAGDEDHGRRRPTAGGRAADPLRPRASRENAQPPPVDDPAGAGVPPQAAPGTSGAGTGRTDRPGRTGADPGSRSVGSDDEPADEPPAQAVPPAQAAQVARMLAEVLVIDGRPRYHRPGCDHLHGRESEPLPVREAMESGFTPCARCEPDSLLLAHARRI
jgi:hypothetical protein